MTEPSAVTIDLQGCARCHGDGHLDLTFRPLEHPVELAGATLTHWAPCPTNGEPILLLIDDPAEAPAAVEGDSLYRRLAEHAGPDDPAAP